VIAAKSREIWSSEMKVAHGVPRLFHAHKATQIGWRQPAGVSALLLHSELEHLHHVLNLQAAIGLAGALASGVVAVHQGLEQAGTTGRAGLAGEQLHGPGDAQAVVAVPGALLAELAAAHLVLVEQLGHLGPAGAAGLGDALRAGDQGHGILEALAALHQGLGRGGNLQHAQLAAAGPGQLQGAGGLGAVGKTVGQLDAAPHILHVPALAVLQAQVAAQGKDPGGGLGGHDSGRVDRLPCDLPPVCEPACE
jgi:hypothetical protein